MKRANIYMIMAAAIGIAAASVGSSQTAIYAKSAAQMLEGPVLQEDKERSHHHGSMSKEQFEAYRLKRLQEMAVYFGISTEGKSADQLKTELLAAKEANKEKWEAFKTEHRAKRLEHLRKIAEKHGIDASGKTEDQLREELEKAHGDKEKHHWKERNEQHREEPTPQPTAAQEKDATPQPTATPEKTAPKGKKS